MSSNKRKPADTKPELASLFFPFRRCIPAESFVPIFCDIWGSLTLISEHFRLSSTIGPTIWCIAEGHVWAYGYFDRNPIIIFVICRMERLKNGSFLLHIDAYAMNSNFYEYRGNSRKVAAYLPVFDLYPSQMYVLLNIFRNNGAILRR